MLSKGMLLTYGLKTKGSPVNSRSLLKPMRKLKSSSTEGSHSTIYIGRMSKTGGHQMLKWLRHSQDQGRELQKSAKWEELREPILILFIKRIKITRRCVRWDQVWRQLPRHANIRWTDLWRRADGLCQMRHLIVLLQLTKLLVGIPPIIGVRWSQEALPGLHIPVDFKQSTSPQRLDILAVSKDNPDHTRRTKKTTAVSTPQMSSRNRQLPQLHSPWIDSAKQEAEP